MITTVTRKFPEYYALYTYFSFFDLIYFRKATLSAESHFHAFFKEARLASKCLSFTYTAKSKFVLFSIYGREDSPLPADCCPFF